jgi:hypothetical protein
MSSSPTPDGYFTPQKFWQNLMVPIQRMQSPATVERRNYWSGFRDLPTL